MKSGVHGFHRRKGGSSSPSSRRSEGINLCCWPVNGREEARGGKNRGLLDDGEAIDVCLRLFREKGFAFNWVSP